MGAIFNWPEHSVCLAHNNEDFCCQDVQFTATNPPDGMPIPPGVIVKYYIHGHDSDESVLCGAAVVSVDGMCAPFDANANQNMFQHLFGIKFHLRITPTFGGFHRSSSRDVLVSLTHSTTVCHTRLANLLSTQRYPNKLWHGFLTRFTLIWCLCRILIASCSHPIDGQLPLPASNRS